MIALIILGSILLLLALIIVLPLTATVVYDNELRIYARALFVRIKILPRKKKKHGPHSMSRRKAQKILDAIEKKKLKKKKKAADKKAKKELKEQKKGKKSLSDVLGTVSEITSLASGVLGRFGRHFHVRISRLQINVATPDAAQTAIAYGAIEAALTQLYATLGQSKNFKLPKDKNFFVRADFASEEMSARIKIHFSFSIFSLISALIVTLIKNFFYKARQKAIAKARREAYERKLAQRRAARQAAARSDKK